MSYTAKTNWQGNDPVTEDDLNRWEKGIKDSHEGLSQKIDVIEKGIAGGVATLDENGKLKSGQIDFPATPDGTKTTKGIVKLSSATDSTSETLAATPKAVKDAKDGLSTQIGILSTKTDGILKSTFFNNKFVDQSNANFVGKIAGSMTVNPNIAKHNDDIVLISPNGAWAEADSARYAKLASLDTLLSTWSIPTVNRIAQQLFSFNLIAHTERTYGTIPGATTAEKVAWLKANLSKLTFNWWGFGSSVGGNKATINAWRNDLNAWNDFKISDTASTITKIGYLIEAPLSAYIDANGFIHFLAYAEPSNGTVASVINTDYVELQVELSTDIKSNLLVSDEFTALKKIKSNKDSNGVFTTVTYRRKSDDTLFALSVLSGGASPNYTTRTVTYYAPNGTSITKIATFMLSYDADGALVSEV